MKTIANTPFDLFFDQLRDIYSVEIQLRDSMPHWVSMCSNIELRELIDAHAHQLNIQIEEIEEIFERHGESSGDDKSKAMAGLIEGGTAHLEEVPSPQTRDLMMIAHCLRIEYYEIAAYEFTTLLSERLGLVLDPKILSRLLTQEKDMAAHLMLLEPSLFKAANVEAMNSVGYGPYI